VATGEAKAVLTGHAGPVSGLAYHPAGRVLASGGGPEAILSGVVKDQEIRLWDVASAENAGVIAVPCQTHSALRFSPDGTTLFANGKGGAILAFDANSLSQ
jgi:WD40 repeat protein